MAEQDQAPSQWEQNVLQSVLMASIKEQRSSRRWGIFFKAAFLAYFVFLLILIWPSETKRVDYHAPHAAMVHIEGMISPNDEANADSIAQGLRNAFNAPQSKAVIMRINSPGGSPVQSSYIYNEVMRLKAKHPEKKVYAVIEDVGASGAYYVAAAADQIYANESSIVGSIGVLMPNFGAVDAIEKLGLQQRTLTAGEYKNLLDPFSPVEEKEVAFVKEALDKVHGQFIAAVKKGRGDRLKDDPTIFSGLFWTGEQGLELGLIDGFGSTGQVARDVVGQEDIVDYTVAQSFFEKLSQQMGTTLGKSLKSALSSDSIVMLK